MGLFDQGLDAIKNAIKNNGIVPAEGSNDTNSSSSKSTLLAALEQIHTWQEDSKYSASIMNRGLKFNFINQSDWNQLFPYAFIILRVSSNNKYISVATCPLPISPQNLDISIPFAITTTVTSRGILEEHNGAPLRNIQFSATTGIMLNRPSFARSKPDNSIIGTVFAGTIAAINQTKAAFESIAAPFQSPSSPENKPPAVGGGPSGDRVDFYSGYYQYHAIRAFLETYAELKRLPSGRAYRLAFKISKDRAVYLVTPQQFNTKRTAASPMEYMYSFSGLAWGTIDPSLLVDPQALGGASGNKYLENDTNNITSILNALRGARGVIQNAKSIITAIKTDIDVNVIGPMNSVILALKEIASVPKTIADLPSQIAQSFQQNVITAWKDLKNQIDPQVYNAFNAAIIVSLPAVAAVQSLKFTPATAPSVLNNIALTDSVNVESLNLTPQQQAAVDNATLAALSINNTTINNLISQLQATSNAMENTALTQGEDSPVWPIIYAINDTITAMYSLIADNTFGVNSSSAQSNGSDNLIATYANLSNTSQMNFQTPNSKISIPFPFKSSLEQLAARYLGDATRWIEIAAVNSLQAPYIDEDGFTYAFISNGSGIELNVASSLNLFNGQDIWITSNTQPTIKRHIRTIQQISSTNYIISVDGDASLSKYTVADNAYIKAYLPNTINSQKLIYIPSNDPSPIDDVATKSIPYIQEDPQLLKLSKIDFLLDAANDLAITNDGFQNLAFGKTNLIQAAKLKMSAIAGKVILHPEYGAGVDIGDNEADVSIDDIRTRISQSFQSDTRFSQVNRIEIARNPGAIEMQVNVQVAEIDAALPLSFQIDQ